MFGTIDTFLIWRLTNRKSHLTDATNASRTLMYNINSNKWDDEILKKIGIPKSQFYQKLKILLIILDQLLKKF